MTAAIPAPSRAHRFLHNFLWVALGQASVFVVNFLTVPYLVRRMGMEAYGLYILLHTAMSYLQVLSLGAGVANIKFVSEFAAVGESGRLWQALRYSAVFHGCGVLLGGVALAAYAPQLAMHVFRVPASLLDTAVFVLRCAAAGALFQSVFFFASTAMQGLHRFDLNAGITLLSSLLTPLVVVGAFWSGRGLKTAACGLVLVTAAVSMAAVAITVRFLPVRGPRGGGDFTWRQFAALSLGMAPGPLAASFTSHFDKVLIAQAMPLSELTLYAIPAGMLQRLQGLAAALSTMLLPLLSEISRPEHEASLQRVYLKFTRTLLCLMLPALILLFAFMPQLLGLWLGQEFADRSVWPARVLVMANVFYLLTMGSNPTAISRNKGWYLSAMGWAQAVLCVLLWLYLIPRYRILGAALGFFVAQAVSVTACLCVVHKRLLNLSWRRFADEGLSHPFICAAVMLAVVMPVHHLAVTWLHLAALSLAGLAAYCGCAWLLLPGDERAFIRGYLSWRPEV